MMKNLDKIEFGFFVILAIILVVVVFTLAFTLSGLGDLNDICLRLGYSGGNYTSCYIDCEGGYHVEVPWENIANVSPDTLCLNGAEEWQK
jgi:hypothetical protein